METKYTDSVSPQSIYEYVLHMLWLEFNFGLLYFRPGSVLIYSASAHDNDVTQGKVNVKLV